MKRIVMEVLVCLAAAAMMAGSAHADTDPPGTISIPLPRNSPTHIPELPKSLVFSAEGNSVLAASALRMLPGSYFCVWNIPTKEKIWDFDPIKYSSSGAPMVSSNGYFELRMKTPLPSSGGTLDVMDIGTGKRFRTVPSINWASAMDFSRDGALYAAPIMDSSESQRNLANGYETRFPRKISVYETATGRELFKFNVEVAEDAPDGSEENRTNAGTTATSVPGAASLAFSPNGKLLACVSSDNVATVWSLEDGKEVAVFRNLLTVHGHSMPLHLPNDLCFLGDNNTLIWRKPVGDAHFAMMDVAAQQEKTDIWDETINPKSGYGVKSMDQSTADGESGNGDSSSSGTALHKYAICSNIVFSPDGDYAALVRNRRRGVGGDSNKDMSELLLVDLKQRSLVGAEELGLGNQQNVKQIIRFSPDGKKLAATSAAGELKIYDVAELAKWLSNRAPITESDLQTNDRKADLLSAADKVIAYGKLFHSRYPNAPADYRAVNAGTALKALDSCSSDATDLKQIAAQHPEMFQIASQQFLSQLQIAARTATKYANKKNLPDNVKESLSDLAVRINAINDSLPRVEKVTH